MQNDRLKLLAIETDEIYRYVYERLAEETPIELRLHTAAELLEHADSHSNGNAPGVILYGLKKLDARALDELGEIRAAFPGCGLLLLFSSYGKNDIEPLRRLASGGEGGGMAVFLRQSLTSLVQLQGIISSVHHGQVILDPSLASVILNGKPESPFLKQLTPRETEILSLLAKGYTNTSIAGDLFIDIKTVEHHLNSIYSKLKTEEEHREKHLRVTATRVYLRDVEGVAV